MGKDRLSYLALLHIHYDTTIGLDVVADSFARRHPTDLNLNHCPEIETSKYN